MPKNGFSKSRVVKHKPSGRAKRPTQGNSNGRVGPETGRNPEPLRTGPFCELHARRPTCQKCTHADVVIGRHFATAEMGPGDLIRIQFDAKGEAGESKMTVHVSEEYLGRPLITASYIKRIQARCWRTRPMIGEISILPDGKELIITTQIISKLGWRGKYYRTVFGLVEDHESRLFTDYGWQTGTNPPDAIIGRKYLNKVNEVPKEFG